LIKGKWSPWSACAATCNGKRQRHRVCDFDFEENEDSRCSDEIQLQDCNNQCPGMFPIFFTTCPLSYLGASEFNDQIFVPDNNTSD